MRKILATATLLVALCCASFAGEMHTPGAPAPPPEPTPTPASTVQGPTDDATLDGIMHTSGVSDILTETALELLAVLPSLF
ncbi:MAG TPA: hypothetical protein VF659_04220 [Pyrinomonadaceae bacterium]|jgi:hypothetical protein